MIGHHWMTIRKYIYFDPIGSLEVLLQQFTFFRYGRLMQRELFSVFLASH